MSNFRKRTKSEIEQSVKKPRVLLEKPTGSDYFNYLNDDCLAKIFKYLSIKQKLDAATVCERWKDASQVAWKDVKTLNFNDPSLPWKELSSYRTFQGIAMILEDCGGSLRELELSNHVNSNILQVLEHHCYNLTKLEVDVSNCGTISANLVLQMKSLSYLKIKGNRRDFSGDVFEALPDVNLTEIHLLVNGSRPFRSVMALPPKASDIFEKLTKLTAITLEGFSLDPNILRVISQKDQMTHLSLINCTPNLDFTGLTLLTNLEHLNLSAAESVDNQFLIGISKRCKKLQYLNLHRCHKITDWGIESLAHLPQIQELDLSMSYIKDIHLRHLHHLRHLKNLNIENCHDVQDSGVMGLIQCATNLEYLNVVYTKVTDDFLQVAADITISRTNNVQLKVIVRVNLMQAWKFHADLFPLLIVDVPEHHKEFFDKRLYVCDSSKIGDYKGSKNS